jgi:parvulin-like peptidyl-prolyl isomerase
MQLRTHLKIDQELSGTPVEVGEGYAVVELRGCSKNPSSELSPQQIRELIYSS